MRARLSIAAIAAGALMVTLPWAGPGAPGAAATSETVGATGTPGSAATTPAAAAGARGGSGAAARAYDLDFTLPTAGKSGCLVCHGDPNLMTVGLETTSSIHVDIAILEASAHARDAPCTGCHLDFASTAPHKQTAGARDWRSTARLACKNCHQDAFSAYANGAHSPAGRPGEVATVTAAVRIAEGKPGEVPLCGTCHGGHAIPSMDDTPAMRVVQVSGNTMCGRCHVKESTTYEDYYHGAAYRHGALDAPACWDCHGYHDILPSSDRRSLVHRSRLADTCGQDRCHAGVDDEFLGYADLVHRRREIEGANPMNMVKARFRQAVEDARATVRSWF